MSIRFNQSCPVCGRRVDIRASLLGCRVACQHCGAEFIATAQEESATESDVELLARVEEALRKTGHSVPNSPASASP